MRKILTLMLIVMASVVFSQTNATFNNLDVRNTTKMRGLIYPFGAAAKTPVDPADEVLMVDLGDFKMVRVDFEEFADSILTGVPVYTVSNRNTLGWYSRTVGNDFQFRGVKTGDTFIDLLDSTTYIQFTLDTADLFNYVTSTNYWTYVNSATDTLKNNVANTDGIIFLDSASLELPPTTATAGQIKQEGVRLLHTYHEKGDNNLFIGQGAGNFTQDSSFNIGIGKTVLTGLTTGFNNIAVGYGSLNNTTTGYNNIAIGDEALNTNVAMQSSIAIGFEAMKYANSSAVAGPTLNIAIGSSALRGSSTASANTGYENTVIGHSVMENNTTGYRNVVIGKAAAQANTIGSANTLIGTGCATSNIQGVSNTAVGYNALGTNQDNDGSTAFGTSAMANADSRNTGERVTYNTAVGYEALKGSATPANNTGQYNTGTGYQVLDAMTSGAFNTVYGYDAGGGITTGDSNILIGTSAGSTLTTQSDLLFIDNTNTTTPLIWGNMRADSLRWNADVVFAKDLWYEDTYWRDATTSATALAPGVNAPSQRTIVGGILGMGYAPSVQNDISYGQVQLNHDYKFDTDIEAHMHFMIEEAAEAGDTAVFALEYSWADIDETFPTSDTLTVLIPCAAITAKQHKLVEFGAITTPGGNNVSSSIIFRLERLQDSPHDTYDGANEYVIVLDVDYHLQIDAPGSRSEYLK